MHFIDHNMCNVSQFVVAFQSFEQDSLYTDIVNIQNSGGCDTGKLELTIVQNINLVSFPTRFSRRTWYPTHDWSAPTLPGASPNSSDTRDEIDIADIRRGWREHQISITQIEEWEVMIYLRTNNPTNCLPSCYGILNNELRDLSTLPTEPEEVNFC